MLISAAIKSLFTLHIPLKDSKLSKSSWLAPTGPWVKVHRAVSDFKTLAPLCDLSIWGHFSKAKDILQWPTDNSPSNRTLTHDCVMDDTLSNGKQIADLLGRVCVFYPLAHVWLIHPEQMCCRSFFLRIPLRSFSLLCIFLKLGQLS